MLTQSSFQFIHMKDHNQRLCNVIPLIATCMSTDRNFITIAGEDSMFKTRCSILKDLGIHGPAMPDD
jgi:hypothetical protein